MWSPAHEDEARALQVWPLDEHNIATLDAVRPRGWEDPPPAAEYELTVLDARCAPVQMFLAAARVRLTLPYSLHRALQILPKIVR